VTIEECSVVLRDLSVYESLKSGFLPVGFDGFPAHDLNSIFDTSSEKTRLIQLACSIAREIAITTDENQHRTVTSNSLISAFL